MIRLGCSYSVWDSEELLEYSIRSIRKNVDYISVVYQLYSNHGESCSLELIPLLQRLLDENLVDIVVLYTPSGHTEGEGPSRNEAAKRQMGLELSRKAFCTHHMPIDCDEFYTDIEFKRMKVIAEAGTDTIFCHHRQYYKDSIYQLKVPEGECVATIEKIYDDTKYYYCIDCPVMKNYPAGVDPTRRTTNCYNGHTYRILDRDMCEMHHMSFVRKDIKKKLWNHSSKRFFTEEGVDRIAEYYKNWKYPQPCMWAGENLLEVIEVPRQFKIYDI